MHRPTVLFLLCAFGIMWVAARALAAGVLHGTQAGLICDGECTADGATGECEEEGPFSTSTFPPITIYTWNAGAGAWQAVGPPFAGSTVSYCVCVVTDPDTGEEVFTSVGNFNCCRLVEVHHGFGNTIGTMGTCWECPLPGSCGVAGPANNAEAVCD